MRYPIIFLILISDIAALAATALFFRETPHWVVWSMAALGIALLAHIYIAIVRPVKTISLGMDLVNSQDFSSRLAKVGHPDADKLVEMFNRMMNSLKNERLRRHEQNSFLSQLIESSPMGIVVLDFDRNVSMLNPAAANMMGLAIGKECPCCRLEEIPGELAGAMATVNLGETRTIRLSDTRIYRCASLSFMESGFPRQFLLIESLTEEVYRAEKAAYEKVIRMIAHEVNNSMAGIKSLLETLAAIMAEDDSLAELIDSCHERCVSMSKFITSYAEVVKLPQPRLASCDLNSTVSRQIPFLEAMIPGGINLEFTPATSPVMVMTDSVMFEQVMVNIVKNAAESILDGMKTDATLQGRISIKVTEKPAGIVIDDNGPGIDAETATHLFTPFFTTKPSGQGIGLLCISEILRRHNCRFSLSTIDESVTRFSITFPDRKQS